MCGGKRRRATGGRKMEVLRWFSEIWSAVVGGFGDTVVLGWCTGKEGEERKMEERVVSTSFGCSSELMEGTVRFAGGAGWRGKRGEKVEGGQAAVEVGEGEENEKFFRVLGYW
ncbi:hypothetical protein HAX54_034288 [Datura stramonium]|uniref:Uncharacterized protein n=1 Tax=Datura stramonium TaxID=4076 RepID=A0ABS8SE35_DATST|nr:hypothetical protein [Datura stramonium]